MATKKNQASTALVVGSGDITDKLELLKEELRGLKEIENSPFKTQGVKVPGFPESVDRETNPVTLTKMWGYIKAANKNYNEAADDLGYNGKQEAFKIGNYAPQSFKEDIQLKIVQLNTEERRKKVEEFVKSYTDLMDRQDKMKLLDLRLNEFLGKTNPTEKK